MSLQPEALASIHRTLPNTGTHFLTPLALSSLRSATHKSEEEQWKIIFNKAVISLIDFWTFPSGVNILPSRKTPEWLQHVETLYVFTKFYSLVSLYIKQLVVEELKPDQLPVFSARTIIKTHHAVVFTGVGVAGSLQHKELFVIIQLGQNHTLTEPRRRRLTDKNQRTSCGSTV